MDRWVLGIIGGFAILIGVYVVFISTALKHAPQIEASYEEVRR